MTTAANLYKQLKEGNISESKFLYEVRKDEGLPFITNMTSFKDAEQMLKNKSIIKEWSKDDQETTYLIDKLNPYRFKKAMYAEMKKLGNGPFDESVYIKIREKVAKKLAADPMAYREEEFMNSDDIKKQDEKLKWVEVKKDNFVDKARQMSKIKGQESLKAQKAPKTENRKGKPKGVKEMTTKAKKAKGIAEVMPETKKERVVEGLFGKIFKKKIHLAEDTHHRFGMGQAVPLPEKDRAAFGCDHGTIKDIKGGTLYLELEVTDEQGQPLVISRQINTVEHGLGGKPHVQKEPVKEPVTNSNGHALTTGQEVVNRNGEKVRIDGFIREKNGKVDALIKSASTMFNHRVDVDELSPVKKEEPKSNAFSRLPNLGGAGQSWLSSMASKQPEDGKMNRLVNRLREISKQNKQSIKKETISPTTLQAAKAGKISLSVKAGSQDQRTAESHGLTYSKY
jgi:hypothetical protein